MNASLPEPEKPTNPLDDSQIRQMVDEVNKILRSTHEHLQKHYPPFREIYRNGYHWPEIDPLRWVIGQSFVQIEIAKREAPRYFAYVDGLARQICVKLFGENYKSELGDHE